jgi:kinesin family protein C2/C3
MCYFLILFILVLSYLESAALARDAAHKLSEMFQQKQGSYDDLSDSNILELMKSNRFDVSS